MNIRPFGAFGAQFKALGGDARLEKLIPLHLLLTDCLVDAHKDAGEEAGRTSSKPIKKAM